MTQQYDGPYRSAMVVVAHADDAELRCSGTVATWCKQGMEVVYILCTDSSRGSRDGTMTPERLAAIRMEEQKAAGRLLGLADVVFLGYADGTLQPTLELRQDITREIRRYKPDVLICQYPMRNLTGNGYLGHPDHIAAGEAALAAVFPSARDHLIFPELLDAGFDTHYVREVLVMDHPEPDRWIDVTEGVDTAVKALMAHESQAVARNAAERIRERRARLAAGHGMDYAETFKQFNLQIPVPT